MRTEMSDKIEKPVQDKTHLKDQNLEDSKLLEKIDEDIQRLNRLKSKLQKKAKKVGDSDLKSMERCFKNDTDTSNTKSNLKSSMENSRNVNLSKIGGKIQRFGKDTDDEMKQWMDNSRSTLMKGIDPDQFRRYELALDRVKDFYQQQHEKQTVAYNIQARINFKTKVRDRMSVWDALIKLNKLLDESDPDTELSQIDHALQTAEAIRRDNKPRWFQCVGLIHDLGKLLYFYDAQGQWDVVGDTFPVGCRFSKSIIYYDFFKENPDYKNPLYNTKYGIYSPHCGLKNVMLSWGHDEYMYNLAKEQSTLPPEGLAMIRYHSFYPWHREGAYKYLMSDEDKKNLKIVQTFNPYDLYSKSDIRYKVEELKPYYLELIDEFFPHKEVEF